MKALHMAAYILLFVGGLAWGWMGVTGNNLVEMLLGATVAQWVYILVGVATVYVVITHKSDCKVCGS